MPDRMPERMSEHVPERMTSRYFQMECQNYVRKMDQGGDHSKKVFFFYVRKTESRSPVNHGEIQKNKEIV
jgi:hypothetical protein